VEWEMFIDAILKQAGYPEYLEPKTKAEAHD
jgi:hypothetical protein